MGEDGSCNSYFLTILVKISMQKISVEVCSLINVNLSTHYECKLVYYYRKFDSYFETFYLLSEILVVFVFQFDIG